MDTPRDPAADRLEALDLLRELAALLRREGEDFWLRAVQHVGGLLEPMDDTSRAAAAEAIGEARRAWRNMNGGSGSFSDLYISRDSADAAANQELDTLRESLSQAFERSILPALQEYERPPAAGPSSTCPPSLPLPLPGPPQ